MRSIASLAACVAVAACTISGDDFGTPDPVDEVPDGDAVVLEDAVRVCAIRDGDTIEIQVDKDAACNPTTNIAVRVKGINAPEVAHNGMPAEPYGNDARDYTQANVGSFVQLEFNSDCTGDVITTCRDDYDRLLAYVRLGDGDDLAIRLLERGLARVYRRTNGTIWPFDRSAEYVEVEEQAQSAGVGLWSN